MEFDKIYILVILAIISFFYRQAGVPFVEGDWINVITKIIELITYVGVAIEKLKSGKVGLLGQMK